MVFPKESERNRRCSLREVHDRINATTALQKTRLDEQAGPGRLSVHAKEGGSPSGLGSSCLLSHRQTLCHG